MRKGRVVLLAASSSSFSSAAALSIHSACVRVCVCLCVCVFAWVRFVVVIFSDEHASVAPLYFVRNKIDDKIKMDNGRFSAAALLRLRLRLPLRLRLLCCEVGRIKSAALNNVYSAYTNKSLPSHTHTQQPCFPTLFTSRSLSLTLTHSLFQMCCSLLIALESCEFEVRSDKNVLHRELLMGTWWERLKLCSKNCKILITIMCETNKKDTFTHTHTHTYTHR